MATPGPALRAQLKVDIAQLLGVNATAIQVTKLEMLPAGRRRLTQMAAEFVLLQAEVLKAGAAATPKTSLQILADMSRAAANSNSIAQDSLMRGVTTVRVLPAAICGNDVCEAGERCDEGQQTACCLVDCPFVEKRCPSASGAGAEECGGPAHGTCIAASGACRCSGALGQTGISCGECGSSDYARDATANVCVRRSPVAADCEGLTTRSFFSSALWSSSGASCHPVALSLTLVLPTAVLLLALITRSRLRRRRHPGTVAAGKDPTNSPYGNVARATFTTPGAQDGSNKHNPGGARWLDRFPSWWKNEQNVVAGANPMGAAVGQGSGIGSRMGRGLKSALSFRSSRAESAETVGDVVDNASLRMPRMPGGPGQGSSSALPAKLGSGGLPTGAPRPMGVLPPGWEQARDPTTHRLYYFHLRPYPG
eukprot:g3131.t1